MGGLFSPPTLRDIKIAYNSSSYISNIFPNHHVKLYMVPTNDYYISPLTVCVNEKDRINMLKILLKYVKKNLKIPKKIQIITSDKDIKYGKKYKKPTTILDSISHFNKTDPFFIILHLENIVNLVKGNWDDDTHFGFSEENGLSIKLIINNNILVVPTFTNTYDINEKQKYNHIKKNINLSKLLQHYVPDILKNKSIKQQKQIIMDKFKILPSKYVPENLKTISSKKVIEELDNYYTSLDKIYELSSSHVIDYIIKKKLYKNCYNNRSNKTKKKIVNNSYNKKTRKNKK
jgi:hypothetical protein